MKGGRWTHKGVEWCRMLGIDDQLKKLAYKTMIKYIIVTHSLI